MTSKKEKSMHNPARTQKRFGLRLLLVAAVIALLTLSGSQAAAQEPETSYSVLYNFCSQPNCADGSNPSAPLIRDEAGNLYGTAGEGGNPTSQDCFLVACGVLFKLDPSGDETVLYSFSGVVADGTGPPSSLVRDEDGNLYGTTQTGGNGGSSCLFPSLGCGVVFKVDPLGKETVLYSFTGGADGGNVRAPLVRDAAGNLYGTTASGGNFSSSLCAEFGGCGVVFKLDPLGKETVLYSFTGGADGGFPLAGLIRDKAGNLYGTAGGGSSGKGVVFKLDPLGKETVLYSFTGGADGFFPNAPLVRDEDGNLYGTTAAGGDLTSPFCAGIGGCGVVFKVDRWGKETVLYAFAGGAAGAVPDGDSLTLGHDGGWDGNLYGTTALGGNFSVPGCEAFGCGVVFKLDRRGKETVLHIFNRTDGAQPRNLVLLKHHHSLYGTAGGGTNGAGVIFKITLDDECDHERGHEWDHERDHKCGHEHDHDWDQ